MKEEIVLCICISTYNRAAKMERLAKEILKCRSDKLSVVIVDDNSSDDTVARLENIVDSRLHVYKNECNLGAKRNWYKTIEMGQGKYLLHFLDRDWIYFQYIENVISLLENETCGFGYIGNMFNLVTSAQQKQSVVECYAKGKEAMEIFAFTLVHPSGVIIRKKSWDALNSKELFFNDDKYGIYPHSYVFALLAQHEKGIRIKYKMIEISSIDNFARQKSNFYDNQKKKLPYWWTPEAHQVELQSLTTYFYKELTVKKSILQGVLKYRFCENLYYATFIYRNMEMDIENTKHYDVKKRYLSGIDLLNINRKFVDDYILFLFKNSKEIIDIQFLIALVKEGIANAKGIIEYKEYK